MNKSLRRDNIVTSPYTAVKKWKLSNALNEDIVLSESGNPIAVEFVSYGSGTGEPVWNTSCNIAKEHQELDRVNYREGEKISGIFYPDLEPQNNDGTFKRVVFSQIRELFYNNYRDPTKMWGLEYIDFDKSQTKKFLADNIRLFDIPRVVFGEKMLENTIVVVDNSLDNDYIISDDGFSNLTAGTNLFSRYQEIYYGDNVFEEGNNDLCDEYLNFDIPTVPISLTASLISTPKSASLVWTDTSDNEDGFVIERSVNFGSYSIWGYTTENVSWSVDPSIVSETTYSYRVYAYNTFGNSDYSNTASVFYVISSCIPATISVQPSSTSSIVGDTPVLFVTATGSLPISYQWRSGSVYLTDGVYYTGSLTNTLTITNVQLIHTGSYDVLVSNACGGATSSAAILTVTESVSSIPPVLIEDQYLSELIPNNGSVNWWITDPVFYTTLPVPGDPHVYSIWAAVDTNYTVNNIEIAGSNYELTQLYDYGWIPISLPYTVDGNLGTIIRAWITLKFLPDPIDIDQLKIYVNGFTNPYIINFISSSI